MAPKSRLNFFLENLVFDQVGNNSKRVSRKDKLIEFHKRSGWLWLWWTFPKTSIIKEFRVHKFAGLYLDQYWKKSSKKPKSLIASLYSSILNRRACTFINFEKKFPPAWPYFGLQVYWFWEKIPPCTFIWIALKKIK